jgi:hypothetical protein
MSHHFTRFCSVGCRARRYLCTDSCRASGRAPFWPPWPVPARTRKGRRHQRQAAGRVHSGRPRAKPGAGPVLDRGGPAARWRVAASRSPITGAIRSRLRQGHHRRRPGRRGQLAKVAARAYDTVGIDSFQALLGLLLIDNQMLERRGPEATWRARCWWGSASLAWLGWRCCPPTCAAAGSVASAGGGQGLRGTRIGVREGEVAEAIFTSRRHPLGIAQADRSGGSTEPNSI